jgi:HEXXH motif-containing protein
MRSELGQTLRYLFGELEVHIPLEKARIATFLDRLETAPISPLTFAIYGDLVLAIDRNELEQAGRLTDALISQPAPSGGLRIRSLGDRMKDEEADRYVRYVNTDPEMPLDLFPPSPPSVDYSRQRIKEALTLMQAGDPELAAEVGSLLREIILCAGSEDPAKYTFDGASSLMLWGAILINANRRGDELGMVQMLAHESAHNLLFGLATEEALLNNDSDERYSSPLRDDPRPLEGIYHATFVLARMHRSIRRLLDHGVLSEDQSKRARIDLERNARSFFESMKTLDDHADMTETGAAIIEGARAYMLSV